METGYYIKKSARTEESFKKYLKGIKTFLIQKCGEEKTQLLIERSGSYFPQIIQNMPYFNSATYDELIVTCAKIMVLKKSLKDLGVGVEEFVALMIEYFRETRGKIPKTIRNIGGKIFLSKLMRGFLKNVAKKVTKNGWPTEVIDGRKQDDFDMKVCTRDCQMVNFITSIGEEDLIPYCSFFDFINAESMGYGLKQTTTIDSGVCTFCFNKRGEVHWPEAIKEILNPV